ncbi:MAG: RNA 3'-terminal phosphate cyclase [Nitrososphaerales archaeon]
MSEASFFGVDGSFGEGGGQILRTTITLSSILNKPVKVENIRAKRNNPGLRPQHIAALRVLADMCEAEVENLKIGASWISFKPGERPKPSLRFDIGTAGSITLVMMATIPAASQNGVGCDLKLIGGTDVKWSPTLDYFRYVVLPAYRLVGIDCTVDIVRRGYYPKGGGIVKIQIKPSKNLTPINIVSREAPPPSAISICSNLPRSVAERQMSSALNYLFEQDVSWSDMKIDVEDAVSPGSSIVLYSVGGEGPFLGADSIGERGKPAEKVGKQVAQLFLKEYSSGAPIDMHMGDMLVTPLFLAEGESKFRVSTVTTHMMTDLHVASILTGRGYRFEEHKDGTTTVTIGSE